VKKINALAQYGKPLLEDGKALRSFLNGCGDGKSECRDGNRTEKGENQNSRRLTWQMPAVCQKTLSWCE
jgi:hypothetical protein